MTRKQNNLYHVFIVILLITGFTSTFIGGYIFAHAIAPTTNTQPLVHTNANVTTTTSIDGTNFITDTSMFLTGKHYFSDSLLFITKNQPTKTLAVTVTRTELNKGYVQNTAVSYFNGTVWERKLENNITETPIIASNGLIKTWTTSIDPSQVLKEETQGEITFNNNNYKYSSGVLENELGIRSLPNYTKFISQGKGTLEIDGKQQDVYVLYTRIYSMNSADIQFYNQILDLTTDWLAFWDADGNFYHVDATNVTKPTNIYHSHQLGIIEDNNQAIAKYFQVSTERSSKTDYAITLGNPDQTDIHLHQINQFNKAPNNSFTWYMGNVSGIVTNNKGGKSTGVGFMEYIHN